PRVPSFTLFPTRRSSDLTLQMSLAYFLVLPLLILSIPTGILRQYVWHHQKKFIVNMLSHPWMSLITFNWFLSIYFIPSVFKAIQTSMFATIIVYVILFISLIFMSFRIHIIMSLHIKMLYINIIISNIFIT